MKNIIIFLTGLFLTVFIGCSLVKNNSILPENCQDSIKILNNKIKYLQEGIYIENTKIKDSLQVLNTLYQTSSDSINMLNHHIKIYEWIKESNEFIVENDSVKFSILNNNYFGVFFNMEGSHLYFEVKTPFKYNILSIESYETGFVIVVTDPAGQEVYLRRFLDMNKVK